MTMQVRDANNDVITIEKPGTTRFYHKAGTAMTRPETATAFVSGDHIADSATANLVTANFFGAGDIDDAPFSIEAMIVMTNDTAPGIVEAALDMHVFVSNPTLDNGVGAGDGAAYTQKMAGWKGVLRGTFLPFSDGSVARLVPGSGDNRIIFQPGSGLNGFWWQLVSRGSFTSSAVNRTWTPYAEGFYGRA